MGEAACDICGRPTYDPDKRSRPWARGVRGGSQVLVGPACQGEHPEWAAGLDRCERCDSTRLGVTLGEVVCRACGHVGSSDSSSGGPLTGLASPPQHRQDGES